MHERFKQRPLTMGVLTGVTALLGGIEPAAADIIPLSQPFGTIITSDSASGIISGSFSDSGSDLTTFSQFNTLGGTRELTGVTVTVTSLSSVLEATVSGSCFAELSTGNCGAAATNDSTFSVAISIAGPFSPLTQLLSTSASDQCTVGESGGSCSYNDSTSNLNLPSDFTFTATIAQLSLFAGLGTFDVTPGLSLAGEHSAFAESTFEASSNVSAGTSWSGTIDVTYEYRLVNGVPEPASLILLGTGLLWSWIWTIKKTTSS